MANIVIITTPEHDKAFATLLRKLNAGRPAPLTAEEFRDYLVAQWLDSIVTQAKSHDESSLSEAYQKADNATKAKVMAALSI